MGRFVQACRAFDLAGPSCIDALWHASAGRTAPQTRCCFLALERSGCGGIAFCHAPGVSCVTPGVTLAGSQSSGWTATAAAWAVSAHGSAICAPDASWRPCRHRVSNAGQHASAASRFAPTKVFHTPQRLPTPVRPLRCCWTLTALPCSTLQPLPPAGGASVRATRAACWTICCWTWRPLGRAAKASAVSAGSAVLACSHALCCCCRTHASHQRTGGLHAGRSSASPSGASQPAWSSGNPVFELRSPVFLPLQSTSATP